MHVRDFNKIPTNAPALFRGARFSQRLGPSPALVNSATASGDHAYTYVLLM